MCFTYTTHDLAAPRQALKPHNQTTWLGPAHGVKPLKSLPAEPIIPSSSYLPQGSPNFKLLNMNTRQAEHAAAVDCINVLVAKRTVQQAKQAASHRL